MRSYLLVTPVVAIFAAFALFSVSNADSALLPSSTVFVRLRGNATNFALKKLSAVATSNGLLCNKETNADPPKLLCQFNQLLYNAVITTTYEQAGLLRIDMYYFDEALSTDKEREAQMSIVVRQFAKELRGSRHVKAIRRCDVPLKADVVNGMCGGQSLW